jgi:transcriptional antiterminator RfaH
MMHWYVVHTQPRAEARALWHLQNQGFQCFLPRVRRLSRHARKVELALAPLFPRYLFVCFELDATRWRAINGTRGVVSLLARDRRPLPVPTGVVEDLLVQCDEQGVAPLAALSVFTKGLKVRIKNGPFIGQTGEVAETFAQGRDWVQVLLNLLGVQASLQLPSYAIEAA